MATSEPGTLSLPSLNDAAPRKAAAMAVRVKLWPTCGLPAPCWASTITPATPAKVPDSTKARQVSRSTRMPTRREAALFEPIACRLRPYGVCSSR